MPTRLDALPAEVRDALRRARKSKGWSQAELGRRAGLPQVHISHLETGKVVPRFDTLLDTIRVLDLDLVVVPRELVPVIHAIVQDFRHGEGGTSQDGSEAALYSLADEASDEGPGGSA